MKSWIYLVGRGTFRIVTHEGGQRCLLSLAMESILRPRCAATKPYSRSPKVGNPIASILKFKI